MSKADKVRDFSQYLRESGYFPSTDEDGDIRFMAEGLSHFVSFDEKDEEFVRVMLPLWQITSADERSRAERAALKIAGTIKCVKLRLGPTVVLATVDILTSSMDNFQIVFPRSITLLRGATTIFRAEMSES